MRIQINLNGSASLDHYQKQMESFVKNEEKIISSFKTVKSKVDELPGGVATLSDARDMLSARIREEENRKNAAEQVRSYSSAFAELVVRIDREVARVVSKNCQEFYEVNPWLRPQPQEEKSMLQKGWEYLKGTALVSSISTAWSWAKDKVSEAWTWTKDSLKKVWNSAVDFYKEHKRLCQVLIGALAITVAVIVTVASGGAALPALIAMTKVALVAGLKGALIGGAISAGISFIRGDDPKSIIKNGIEGGIDGFCSGFMIGGIMAAGSQISHVMKGPKSIKKYQNLDEYTNEDFDTFREYNQDSQKFNKPKRLGEMTSDTAKMDSLMERSELSKDLVVNRGTSIHELGEYQALSPEELIGKTVSSSGYMSTTPGGLENVNRFYQRGVVMELFAPKGISAIDASETIYKEVVFNAGTTYEITEAWKDINNILFIKGTIIP